MKIFTRFRKFCILITLVVLTCAILPRFNRNPGIFKLAGLTSSGLPISINSNADLASKADGGAGTISNPYIIENKNINANGTGSAIYIQNTNKYLVIRNCTLVNSGSTSGDSGIRLNNCTNINITKNIIVNNHYFGIAIYSSSKINIFNNNISDNSQHGIVTYYSPNLSIQNNMLSFNSQNGIRCLYSSNDTISVNSIIGNNWGIFFSDVNTTLISNNIVSRNTVGGIYIDSSSKDQILGNDIQLNQNYGICLYSNLNDTIIGNDTKQNIGYGILLQFSLGTNITGVNSSSNTIDGFYLYYSNFTLIYTNLASYNKKAGIELYNSSHDTIYENQFANNSMSEGLSDNLGFIKWDNGSRGNYWGDYVKRYPFATNNGVVWNTPYQINTSAYHDNFPLVKSPSFSNKTQSHNLVLSTPIFYPIIPVISTDGTIQLSWSASSGATMYKLYRYTSFITVLNGTATLIGNFTSTNVTETNLENGTYYFVVVAINATMESSISNCVSCMVAIPPKTPPSIIGWIILIVIIIALCVVIIGIILHNRRHSVKVKKSSRKPKSVSVN